MSYLGKDLAIIFDSSKYFVACEPSASHSDAHFNSHKVVTWQLYVVYAYLLYKKVPSKILYFGHSAHAQIAHNKIIKKGACPYIGIRLFSITVSFFI